MFVGFHLTFFAQHIVGNEGMPRRYVDHLPTDGFTIEHMLCTGRSCSAPRCRHLWNVREWSTRRGSDDEGEASAAVTGSDSRFRP